MAKKQAETFADIVSDADKIAASYAKRSKVVPLKAKEIARQTRRPSTRVWDKNEVATRALDLYALERAAEAAYGRAIERAEKFKENEGIDGHVDHKDPAFRRYTAKQWNAYLGAKDEVKKAKARLTTACRNCLHGAPKRERINPKDVEAWKVLFAQIKAGTISMVDALAVRDSKGDAFVKSREVFIALQAPDAEDGDMIPF